MELAFQWELLEDEIPAVFEKLLQSIRQLFLNFKSILAGQFTKTVATFLELGSNSQSVNRNRLRSCLG